MIAIDRIEGVEWPTANNDRFGDPTHTVWTDNGETESTNVIRICAINIGDACDNPFSTGHPEYGLCHSSGKWNPGTSCPRKVDSRDRHTHATPQNWRPSRSTST